MLKKQEWIKPWEREYNLHKMDSVLAGLLTPYAKRIVGSRFPGVMAVLMPSGNDGFFFKVNSFALWHAKTLAAFRSKQGFGLFLREYNQLKKEFVNISIALGKKARTTHEPRELFKLLREFSGIDIKYVLVGQWFGFYLGTVGEEVTRSIIAKVVHDPKKQEEYLRTILSHDKMSEIRKERAHMLMIALEPNKNKQAQLLKQHARKFTWMPCINVMKPRPWKLSHFKKELQHLLKSGTAARELKELKQTLQRNKDLYQSLKKKFNAADQVLLERAHLMTYIRDERDDARRKAYYYINELYERIVLVLGMKPQDITLYTMHELLCALKTGEVLLPQELKARRNGYALIVSNYRVIVKTGKEYHNILKQVNTSTSNCNEVRGVIACSGIVRGRARIVPNVYSIHKVKKGDVLVTVATHPDYLPAMRKACAFVTDEGGLTSHAAVVSRELGKPCVISTKEATHIFKDDDLIEVDAEKGIIKKL